MTEARGPGPAPADFYTGIVVDAYAKLKSSSFDAEPYAAFVRASGGAGLEIGCGDGEPLLDLAAAGLDVDGVDSSPDMVQRCRAHAARRGLDVEVLCQRAEALDLPRRYAAIYLAGPTFNLIPDDEAALAALRGIREHLTDDGRALVPLWVPAPTPDDELGVTREAAADDGATVRYTALSETYDPELRTRRTRARYQRVPPTGDPEVAEREWLVHWHTPEGFEALCDAAGLEVLALLDDATGEPIAPTGPAGPVPREFTATLTRHPTRP